MIPAIKVLIEKKLVGRHLSMSLANNKTHELWKSVMTDLKTIKNRLNTELISMQVYNSNHNFNAFQPEAVFEKWAAAEVADLNSIPDGMESFVLKGGLYAVFSYKGNQQQATAAFQYIFGTWLPSSHYTIDNRPHFEILGDKYKNGDPDSEEEIWIPIKYKM